MLILGYHSVHPRRTDALAVHPRQFVAQLEWLRRRYRILPLRDVVLAYLEGKPTKHLAAITFDDGMRDNYLEAFPILRAARLPATVFLAIEGIETGKPFSGENLHPRVDLPAEELLPLTWPQIHEMQAANITFGSHTFSHRRLPRLSDAELRHEVGESKTFLEEKLGTTMEFFCYPFGDFDERAKQAAIAAGYTATFVTPPRPLPSEDAHCLHRVGVYRDTSLLKLKLKSSPLGRKLRPLVLHLRAARNRGKHTAEN